MTDAPEPSVTSWLQLGLAAAGGFMAAVIGAVTAAWNFSKELRQLYGEIAETRLERAQQIADLKVELLEDGRKSRHDMNNKIQELRADLEMKMDANSKHLEQRIRDVERAVDRMPAHRPGPGKQGSQQDG